MLSKANSPVAADVRVVSIFSSKSGQQLKPISKNVNNSFNLILEHICLNKPAQTQYS